MEALILYFVLFFPSVYTSGISVSPSSAGSIPFSAINELARTLTYSIPSLVLLWYLVTGKFFSGKIWERKHRALGRLDLYSFAAGLPVLIIIGFVISLLVSFFSKYYDIALPLKVEAPVHVWGWVVMVFACLCTGYLEESYFRYYLLTKFESQLPNPVFRILLSTIMFSFCHVYEGPWGILNSALAGLLLSALFLRFRSVHGIAWAHGAYNIFVYTMGIF